MRKDVVVLGAGIVGVSIAVHLQKRGRSVLLVDRRKPGEETSFGNAGLIQREGVYPYGFPHDFGALLRYALNNTIDAHYHWAAIPKLAPFLWQYWMHSRPAQHKAIARMYAPLIEHSVTEHMALAEESGSTHLIRPTGWMKVFRDQKSLDEQFRDAEEVKRDFGVNFDALDTRAVAEREPHLQGGDQGRHPLDRPGLGLRSPHADHGLMCGLFERLGGELAAGDATTLEETPTGWRVQTEKGPVEAGAVVVALGAWADVVTTKLGYNLPLAVKRGYHMHYKPRGQCGAQPADARFRPRLFPGADVEGHPPHDRAPNSPTAMRPRPRSSSGAPSRSRGTFFPLGERVDPEPWMGMRPCTPDMMPIIGPAPGTRTSGSASATPITA